MASGAAAPGLFEPLLECPEGAEAEELQADAEERAVHGGPRTGSHRWAGTGAGPPISPVLAPGEPKCGPGAALPEGLSPGLTQAPAPPHEVSHGEAPGPLVARAHTGSKSGSLEPGGMLSFGHWGPNEEVSLAPDVPTREAFLWAVPEDDLSQGSGGLPEGKSLESEASLHSWTVTPSVLLADPGRAGAESGALAQPSSGNSQHGAAISGSAEGSVSLHNWVVSFSQRLASGAAAGMAAVGHAPAATPSTWAALVEGGSAQRPDAGPLGRSLAEDDDDDIDASANSPGSLAAGQPGLLRAVSSDNRLSNNNESCLSPVPEGRGLHSDSWQARQVRPSGDRWQRISSLPRFPKTGSYTRLTRTDSQEEDGGGGSIGKASGRRFSIGGSFSQGLGSRGSSRAVHWGCLEKAACLVEQAMQGHTVPVDTVVNDDDGASSRSYLLYQRLAWLRRAMMGCLFLLPFFELPEWCKADQTQPCGDRDEYGLSGVPYFAAWLTYTVEAACVGVAVTSLALQHHFLGSVNFWKNKICVYKTCVILLLGLDRVALALIAVLRDYSSLGSGTGDAATVGVSSAPFLHIVLALLFSRAIRGCVRIALRIITGFFDVMVLVCMYVAFSAWLAFVLFSGSDASSAGDKSSFPSFWAALKGMFILLTTANNPDLWIPAFQDNRLSFFFFSAYLGFGLFFLMNLVLSVVYNSYKTQIGEWGRKRVEARSQCLRAAFAMLDADSRGWIPSATFTALLCSMQTLKGVPDLKQKAQSLFLQLDRRGDFRIWDDEFDDLCDVLLQQFAAPFWRGEALLHRTGALRRGVGARQREGSLPAAVSRGSDPGGVHTGAGVEESSARSLWRQTSRETGAPQAQVPQDSQGSRTGGRPPPHGQQQWQGVVGIVQHVAVGMPIPEVDSCNTFALLGQNSAVAGSHRVSPTRPSRVWASATLAGTLRASLLRAIPSLRTNRKSSASPGAGGGPAAASKKPLGGVQEEEAEGGDVDLEAVAQAVMDHWTMHMLSNALLATALGLVLTSSIFAAHVWRASILLAEYAIGWMILLKTAFKMLIVGFPEYTQSSAFRYDAASSIPLLLVELWAPFAGYSSFPSIWIELALIFRSLKLLTLSKHFPRGYVILSTVSSLVPMLLPILGLQYVVCAVFSLLGMLLFGGTVYTSNPSLVGTEYLEGGFAAFNYNDFGSAMATSFNLCVVNNWFVFMDGITAASGNAWLSTWFFVSFYFVVVVFVLNVVVAFLLEAFLHELQAHEVRGPEDDDERLQQKIKQFTKKHRAHFHHSPDDFSLG